MTGNLVTGGGLYLRYLGSKNQTAGTAGAVIHPRQRDNPAMARPLAIFSPRHRATLSRIEKRRSPAVTRVVALSRMKQPVSLKGRGQSNHLSRYAMRLMATTLPAASVSRWSAYHCIMVRRCSRYLALL